MKRLEEEDLANLVLTAAVRQRVFFRLNGCKGKIKGKHSLELVDVKVKILDNVRFMSSRFPVEVFNTLDRVLRRVPKLMRPLLKGSDR